MGQLGSFPTVLQFKKVNCKNCYKCVRYCPVKAIKICNHQAQIIESQCILCEKCTLVCPQNAKVERNLIPEIEKEIQKKTPLIASVHPSYLAKYALQGFSGLGNALERLGFSQAFEASEGAFLMKNQYEQVLKERGQKKLTISSACPVIVQLIEKHYPELVENLAPVLSVMQAHGKYLKSLYPNAKVVYIGPCISSMAEMGEPENYVDYVITFQELNEWMEREKVMVSDGEDREKYLSRAAALLDGITLSMRPIPGQKYLSIHGMDDCHKVLKELLDGGYEDCFLEMNACANGCVGGASFQKDKERLLDSVFAVRNASLVKETSDYEQDYRIDASLDLTRAFGVYGRHKEEMVPEEEIREILAKMGKYTEKDELNCGACGYDTCRDKAIAIRQNKAEISMCIPYMRERQESYSNKIINAMPGLLVTVDYQLNVIHMNQAARDIFDIQRKKQMIGMPVSRIMDDYSLASMVSFDRSLMHDEIYLEDQGKYLDRVMTNDRKNQLILCVMKDVTKEIERKKQIHSAQVEAASIADRLVEEQLRIVHQIAGLLGETAADTKVAVEELKNTILLENGTGNGKE